MRKVFTLGETVLDILFKDGKPISSTPGGSCLNSAVSLGRAGVSVYFISEFGNDIPGKLILNFLHLNNVNTDYVIINDKIQTTLALAYLDSHNNPEYQFYKPPNNLSKLLDHNTNSDNYFFNSINISEDDIVIFGSYFSICKYSRNFTKSIIQQAIENNAIILYDPNFRKPHLHELNELMTAIKENILYSDIIRASDEDFQLIFKLNNPLDIINRLSISDKLLFYTKAANGVDFFYRNYHKQFPAPEINILSSVGAGDSFNAGLAYGLIKYEIRKKQLVNFDNDAKSTNKIIDDILNFALNFAGSTCQSMENYINPEILIKK